MLRSELKSSLSSFNSKHDEIISLKNEIIKNFDKRFPIEKITILAALLDPRYIRLYDVEDYLEKKALTKSEFLYSYIADMEISNVTDCSNNNNNEKTNATIDLVQKHPKRESEESVQWECHLYVNMAKNVKILTNQDVLSF